MRIAVITVIMMFSFIHVISSQTTGLENPEQFLFPEFSVGVLKLKNGEKVNLVMNYNLVTEKMVFMQKGQVFDVVNYSAIDTVYIRKRRFVPAGVVFHELLTDGKASLFIQNKGKLKSPPQPAAYGGTSEVSSSTYIDNLSMSGNVYRMDRSAPVIVIPDKILWIRNEGVIKAVAGKKTLMKIFSDRRQEIRTYLSKYKPETESTEQILNLVSFYNNLF